MQLLPNNLIFIAKPLFKTNTTLFAQYLAIITAGNCIEQLIRPTITETIKDEQPKKKRSAKKQDIEEQETETTEASNDPQLACIFPHKFADKSLLIMCGQYINEKMDSDLSKLTNPYLAIKMGAWYYITHGIFNLNLEQQKEVLNLKFNDHDYNSLYGQYLNLLSKI